MKLNLGSGSKILDGYTNVDKFDYYKPDVIHDLEIFLILLKIILLMKFCCLMCLSILGSHKKYFYVL